MQIRSLATGLALLGILTAGCLGGEDAPDDTPDETPLPATTGVFHRPGGEIVARAGALAVGGAFGTGFAAVEPTLGVDADGRIFMTALSPDGVQAPTIVRSEDHGATWTDVGPDLPVGIPVVGSSLPPLTLDPYVYVDPATGRVFQDDIFPLTCTFLSWSDDHGASWMSNPVACGNPHVNDHQTLVAATPRLVPTVGYPNVLHLCFNNVAYPACTASLDGGLTWRPQVPVAVEPDDLVGICSSLTGHLKADGEGRVFLPTTDCSTQSSVPVVWISEDDGLTWTKSVVAQSPASFGGAHETAVAADEDGNLFATWTAEDGQLWFARSVDHGGSWSEPVNVTAPGVTATWFNAVAAGGPGKVAFAYIGTRAPGGYANESLAMPPSSDEPNDAVWHAYIGFIEDALVEDVEDLVVQSVRVTDADRPIARGLCGATRCDGMTDFIDLWIGPDGRPWGAFVDVCHEDCETDPAVGHNGNEGFVATLLSGPPLRGEETLLSVLPPPGR